MSMPRRLPCAALTCALVALLNSVCWSIVTPAFQVPDEPDHFAYVKQLAERGQLPTSDSEQLSPEELAVLEGLHSFAVRQQPQDRTISSSAEEAQLQKALASASKLPRSGSPDAGVATNQPPLYYAVEAIPYRLAGPTLLDRLQLMRLFSALFAALTGFFAYLFVREALPGAPWAWSVGGLAVAFTPLLGFMSGSVNPDAMLFAVCAAVFYLLARAFRRGLDMRLAVALGAATAVGFLTKLNFVGLSPGIFLGMLLLTRRGTRVSRRRAYQLLAIAAGVALSPIAIYALRNALSGHPLLGIVSTTLRGANGSLLARLDYVWQLYLPRLPGTADYFPGLFTTRQLWFDGSVGLYGWLDTPFPGWVYDVALIPAATIALLCGRALFASRFTLRRRAGELCVYAVMSIGLLMLVGADSFNAFPETDAEYAQARYLLPLLALFAAVLALAARGAGRRWGATVGVAIVLLCLGHDIFSDLQVVARYYG
jgi:4-amino-4-deoxy-L-arabinose transferase-like glycosyltransferase